MEQTKTPERHTVEAQSERGPDDKNLQFPDRCWGWGVCFAGFRINSICYGLDTFHGIIALGLTEYFDATLSKTTMISSIFIGVGMCVGKFLILA